MFHKERGLVWDVVMFDSLSDGPPKVRVPRTLTFLNDPEF